MSSFPALSFKFQVVTLLQFEGYALAGVPLFRTVRRLPLLFCLALHWGEARPPVEAVFLLQLPALKLGRDVHSVPFGLVDWCETAPHRGLVAQPPISCCLLLLIGLVRR